jgi:uncharacterized membrane protein
MRFLGHPVHPILVAFPLALLVLTPIWDGLAFFGVANVAPVAHWTELAGLVGGGLAAVTGLVDFMRLKDPSPRLTTTALRHAGAAVVSLGLFVIAFALRGGASREPKLHVVALELVGAFALAVTGWFGGHLVFGYGVGVERHDER